MQWAMVNVSMDEFRDIISTDLSMRSWFESST